MTEELKFELTEKLKNSGDLKRLGALAQFVHITNPNTEIPEGYAKPVVYESDVGKLIKGAVSTSSKATIDQAFIRAIRTERGEHSSVVGDDANHSLRLHRDFIKGLLTNTLRVMDDFMPRSAAHVRRVSTGLGEATLAIFENEGEAAPLNKANINAITFAGLLTDVGKPLLFYHALKAFEMPVEGQLAIAEEPRDGADLNGLLAENDISKHIVWMKFGLQKFIKKHQPDGLFNSAGEIQIAQIADEIILQQISGEMPPAKGTPLAAFDEFMAGRTEFKTEYTNEVLNYFRAINTYHATEVDLLTRSPILSWARAAGYHNQDFLGHDLKQGTHGHAYPEYMRQDGGEAKVADGAAPKDIPVQIERDDMSLTHWLFPIIDKFTSRLAREVDPETQQINDGAFWRTLVTYTVSQEVEGQSVNPEVFRYLIGDVESPNYDPAKSVLGKVLAKTFGEENAQRAFAPVSYKQLENEQPVAYEARLAADKGFKQLEAQVGQFYSGLGEDGIVAIKQAENLKSFVADSLPKVEQRMNAAGFKIKPLDLDGIKALAKKATGWAYKSADGAAAAIESLRDEANLLSQRFAKGGTALAS